MNSSSLFGKFWQRFRVVRNRRKEINKGSTFEPVCVMDNEDLVRLGTSGRWCRT
jgi:hypothetical protein